VHVCVCVCVSCIYTYVYMLSHLEITSAVKQRKKVTLTKPFVKRNALTYWIPIFWNTMVSFFWDGERMLSHRNKVQLWDITMVT